MNFAAFDSDTLQSRRARVARELALTDEVLLVGAGEPVPLPENTDQHYPFRAHSEYFYLAGSECPGGVVAFDAKKGPAKGWTSFVPDVTEAERVWEAREQPAGESFARLERGLTARRGLTIIILGALLRGVRGDEARAVSTREKLAAARRPKDAAEVALLRRAAEATAAGFAALRAQMRPGITERALQVELEAAFLRAGADGTGYGTIVGAASNSAVLHFHPSERALRKGDFVLVDAGAMVDRYVIDVTRTDVVGGKPTRFQRDLLQLVRATEETAIERCLPGAEWKEIHLAAAIQIVAGLVDMDLLRGQPESLVEQEAHMLFFPHGLGHLVGLGVRDASGRLAGRAPDSRASLKNLRMDLPLQPGFVATVEPGVYFIPAILQDPKRRREHRRTVNWDLVDRHLDIGGVRIEDNVLITDGAPEILTSAVPK